MSRRRIIESEIEMITEEVEDDSAIIYDKDARSKVRSFAKKEEAKRWSLQEEIAKTFEQPLKHGLFIWNDVPCSVSPCYREFRLVVDANDMIERSRCFVSTPGFIHYMLSREWIARSIHKMIKDGIDTWAPKLSVKKAIIYFWSRNIAKKMSMGHLRSTFIGESLALMLEYSRVEVIRRFHEGDDLDIKSKMIMTKFLIERFPIGEVDDQATGEPEGPKDDA
ncbi:arginine--tRNA ligase, chloroplastic/mitochondrial-like protein isoform X2 [Tanacetum coccineum]